MMIERVRMTACLVGDMRTRVEEVGAVVEGGFDGLEALFVGNGVGLPAG